MRQPTGPGDRGYLSYVNTSTAEVTPDPRLLGRAVRRIVYSQEQIAARVKELGDEITASYPDGELLVLGLLKGSFIFLSDLVRDIGPTGLLLCPGRDALLNAKSENMEAFVAAAHEFGHGA